MMTASIVTLIALGIALLAVLLTVNASRAKRRDQGDGGGTATDTGSSDCGSDGGGGCD